ncbi:hypothetical protein PAGU2595_010540 [Lysobacter xanthus]
MRSDLSDFQNAAVISVGVAMAVSSGIEAPFYDLAGRRRVETRRAGCAAFADMAAGRGAQAAVHADDSFLHARWPW